MYWIILIEQLQAAVGQTEPVAETWSNLTHCGLVTPYGGRDLGSSNGSVPDGTESTST